LEIRDLKTEEDLLKEEGFTQEDKKEIFQQIEKIARKNQINVTPEVFKISSQKSGALFPLVVNLMAIAIIGGSFLGLSRYFSQKENNITLETNTYFSAEGQLISEVLKESEEKLREKEDEISRIQEELSDISSQQEQLLAEMEMKVQSKEEELQQQLAQQLELEKQRLQEQGISPEELEGLLAQWEQAKRQELDFVLEDYKATAAQELNQKEEELGELRTELQTVLGDAEAEKNRLAQMAEETRQEVESLQAQNTAIETELDQLTNQRVQEDLVMDQLIGVYQGIQEKMEEGSLEEARDDLEGLKDLLDEMATKNLPLIEKRLETERFLAEALETLLTDPESMGAREIAFIEDLNTIVSQADTMAQSGQSMEALALYNQAINTLPSVARAYNQLQSLEYQAEMETLAGQVRAVKANLDNANPSGALQEYLTLVDNFFPDDEQAGFIRSGIEGAFQAQLSRSLADKNALVQQHQNQEDLYQQEIAGYQEQLGNLNTAAASQQEALQGLNEQLQQRQQRVTELEEYQEGILQLRSDFIAASTKLKDRIQRDDREGIQYSLNEFDRIFSSSQGKRVLPGIEDNFLALLSYVEDKTRKETMDIAEDIALETTIDIARYLSGSVSLTESEKKAIEARLQEDQTFEEMIDELQILAQRGQMSKDLKKNSYLMLGVVSYSLGDSIIIERLTDLLVSQGQKVQFQRQQGANKTVLAQGVIDSMEGSKILTRVSAVLEENPRAGDIVFVEVPVE